MRLHLRQVEVRARAARQQLASRCGRRTARNRRSRRTPACRRPCTCFSSRCQPRGRGISTAVLSFSRYCLPPCSKLIVRRTASRRLSCPSTMLCQVGQLASSKSAMKVEAPQLSALITILRSVGPVISTRRSSRSLRLRRRRSSRPPLSLSFAGGNRAACPASNSFCRAARRASSSWRRGSKRRCRRATKSSASSVRISPNAGVTRPLREIAWLSRTDMGIGPLYEADVAALMAVAKPAARGQFLLVLSRFAA